jgi:preprotein translocase subunit SecE
MESTPVAQLAEQRSPKPQVGGSSPSWRASLLNRASMKDKIVGFFNDVVKEMKKVTWPTKEELKESTVIVVVVCLIIAAFTYVIDMAISQLLKGIF